ncbi:SDR family oxidoreductase [Streptomyces sp. NPDC048417]|uniref:SDR family oxidoreductase n=1 Tax=Streptomyces sp. NPDC048417 TaxID=3155387 RepID=UPI0034236BAF
MAAYSVGKAALNHLVRVLDLELRLDGIRVNAVAPQLLDTARNRAVFPPQAPAHAVRPEVIANVIAFLVGALAAHVSGAIVPACGAWSDRRGQAPFHAGPRWDPSDPVRHPPRVRHHWRKGSTMSSTNRRSFLARGAALATVPTVAALADGALAGQASAATLPDYAPVPPSALGPAVNAQGYYVGRIEKNLWSPWRSPRACRTSSRPTSRFSRKRAPRWTGPDSS